MSTIPACSVRGAAISANSGPPRATEYCAVALALACAALALTPVGGAMAGAPCACAAAATLLGLTADRSKRRMVSAIWELLAAAALLATLSAILTQALLAQPASVSVASMGMGGIAAAFAFASALFGASRALHRLGAGTRS